MNPDELVEEGFLVEMPVFVVAMAAIEAGESFEDSEACEKVLLMGMAGLGPYVGMFTDDDLAQRAVEYLEQVQRQPKRHVYKIDDAGFFRSLLLHFEGKGIKYVGIDKDLARSRGYGQYATTRTVIGAIEGM